MERSGLAVQLACQANALDFGRSLREAANPQSSQARRRSKLPGDFLAFLKEAVLHAPSKARNQPTSQAPSLNDGVRSMLDVNLAQGLHGAGGRSRIERLGQDSPPILESPPVEVRGDPPADSAGASLELTEPGCGGRH